MSREPVTIDHDTQKVEADDVRRRLAALAWLLDSSIPLAGGRYRIGLDAIIGLIPGFGDLIGVLVSSYIVREAARLGAPRSVLTHMVLNVAIEGVVGLIPFAGDVFDAAWKANQRNVALLEAHLDQPVGTARASRWYVAGIMGTLIVFIAATAAAGFFIIRALVSAFTG
ncbi:MAG TPA: DUF4112 domain-containing protein [Burkholderiales bacterium]|nr:DUF4112 domain-containing protein [Burkholderiales bacterium]